MCKSAHGPLLLARLAPRTFPPLVPLYLYRYRFVCVCTVALYLCRYRIVLCIRVEDSRGNTVLPKPRRTVSQLHERVCTQDTLRARLACSLRSVFTYCACMYDARVNACIKYDANMHAYMDTVAEKERREVRERDIAREVVHQGESPGEKK